MKTIKIIIAIIGGILILIGFLSWRLEFILPFFPFWYYILGGIAIGVSMIYGKLVGPLLMGISVIPFGYALILFLFYKETQFKDVSTAIIVGIIALGAGFVLYHIGSESMRKGLTDTGGKIFCASCDQYLGAGVGFTTPCPRCGSNRYKHG